MGSPSGASPKATQNYLLKSGQNYNLQNIKCMLGIKIGHMKVRKMFKVIRFLCKIQSVQTVFLEHLRQNGIPRIGE